MKKNKIDIIATIGPACDSVTIMKKMIQAGMTIARLNFSHGTHEDHARLLRIIRDASEELQVKIDIMQDVQGPKIRVQQLKQPIEIKTHDTVTLTTLATVPKNTIPIQYKKLPSEVSKDTLIYINDGLIRLEVVSTDKKNNIRCKVLQGGTVESRKGINVINGKLTAVTPTTKDKIDIKWGIKNRVDYIAVSFVKSAQDIIKTRKFLKNAPIKIIAKIERIEAIETVTLEEIIKVSDAVMVARGDLGVEIGPENVPLAQKKIIHLANLHGKPVITATQMLMNMIENPVASRAEISDCANAILDHTDGLMLSNETSVGKYPVKAVQTLAKVTKVVLKNMEENTVF